MQRDFDRAGGVAWLTSLSFGFTRVRLPGLSAFSNYAEGYRAIDSQRPARRGPIAANSTSLSTTA